MKITIPKYKAKSRNQVTGKHWSAYQRHKKELFSLMLGYCDQRHVIYPAQITIQAFYKGKRGVDTSNLDDKIIVDAVMNIGIIEDDTARENPRVIKEVFLEAEENKLVITIEKVDNTN